MRGNRKLIALEQEYLSCAIQQMKSSLETAPNGKLKLNKSNGVRQFNIKYDDGRIKYITKENSNLIIQLAQKDYETKLLPIYENQLCTVDRYLKLAGCGTVYPDFTILDVMRRREIIFEHFGMMDNPEYANKAISKINAYIRNGYMLGDNFMFTFESRQQPIDMKNFEKQIRSMLDI